MLRGNEDASRNDSIEIRLQRSAVSNDIFAQIVRHRTGSPFRWKEDRMR